ncbi:hypothetical protein J4Q44_G00330740 [Coregonus suidteri]|uniref:Ubiquitin carboxyl-terminal hydrolase 2 n=1 Tax=Coregonus suidteri TaxID=861788 RepID=A0AAN8QPL7_9TELE
MSRVSTTAKRYTGSSYTSAYSSYGSSLTPSSLSSYTSNRDKLPSYRSNAASSSGYSSSSYLSSTASRARNYSTSSELDRGRPIPRTDLLSSSSRRSESLSRTPVKTYGSSGLSGGSGYSSYSSYSSSTTPSRSSYLSSSPGTSSISLSRRRSSSQSDLTRDLSSLGLTEPTSPSSSALRGYRSRASDLAESYNSSMQSSSYGLSRSSTQEALSSSSLKSGGGSRFTSSYERSNSSSNGRSSSPTSNSPNSKSAQGLVGLRNLGNTCFMNSILQCLSNTHNLRDYCLHNSYRRDLNKNSRTNTGTLMEEFAKLLQTMWTSSSSEAVGPSEFKTQIQRYAPDSWDTTNRTPRSSCASCWTGCTNEVNRVTVRPRGSSEDFDHLPDREKGERMWSKYLEREDSKVVDLFVGQLKSSLTCSTCGYCSLSLTPSGISLYPSPGQATEK